MKELLIFVIIEYLVLNLIYTIDLIKDYEKFHAIVMKLDERSRTNQEHCDNLGEGGK